MAANLAGMFAQINNAIQADPTADLFGGLMDNVSQSGNRMLSDAIGTEALPHMTEMAKQNELKRRVGQMDLSTAEGMSAAAKQYGLAGQQEAQMKLAQAAEAKQKEQQLRESLVKRANKYGLKGLAESTAAGGDLAEANKLVSDYERDDLLLKKGAAARKGALKAAGVTDEEIEQYNLLQAPVEDVKLILEGQKGQTKAYVDAAGNPTMLRTSDYGRVWDKASKQWKNPSEMGLTPAPQVQKVYNKGDALTKALVPGFAADFKTLKEEAMGGLATLAQNQDALNLLDAGINTGALAGVKTMAGKAALMLGIAPELAQDAAQTEAYLGNRALQIGQEIKAFGSGTGLSDKDAERAENIAAGRETMTEDAMRFLIDTSTKLAQAKVDAYETVAAPLRAGDEDGFIAASLALPPVRKEADLTVFETPETTSTVNKYLEEARGNSR